MDSIKALIDDVIIDVTRVLQADSPYQKQKIAILAGYLLIAVLTIGWSVSGGEAALNDLGARVESHLVELSGERWILILNESDDDWERVRITADNGRFYHPEIDMIQSGQTVKIFANDFRATVYLPRAARLSGPEASTHPPQEASARAGHVFKSIRLRTEDAQYLHTFVEGDEKVSEGAEEDAAPEGDEAEGAEEAAEE